MERDYKINLSYLYSLRNAFMNSKNKKYDDDIITLNNLINKLKGYEVKRKKISPYLQLETDAIIKPYLDAFYQQVKVFNSIGSYFEEPLVPKYKSILLTDIDVVNLAKEFFHEQGSFYYYSISDYLAHGNERMCFFKPNNLSEGEINIIRNTDEVFLLAPNYRNITKLSITIHELQHVIDYYNNPEFSLNPVISETAALFMEMIGCDWINKKLDLNPEETEKRKFSVYSIVKREALDVESKTDIIESYNELENHTRSDVDQMLIDDDISDEYFRWAFAVPLVANYNYQIAYYIAIELYFIYKKDKRYALSILQDIIINGSDDNIFCLLGKYNIILNASTLKYEDEMAKVLKI